MDKIGAKSPQQVVPDLRPREAALPAQTNQTTPQVTSREGQLSPPRDGAAVSEGPAIGQFRIR